MFSVSDCGSIRNNKTQRILSITVNKNGYSQVSVKPYGRSGGSKVFRVHREVAIAFLENPENKPVVNHIDGVKTNNSVHNLEWVTDTENMRHAFDNGLLISRKGTQQHDAKLNDDIIRKIRLQHIPRDSNFGARALARTYGVSHSEISKILSRKSWKHVD